MQKEFYILPLIHNHNSSLKRCSSQKSNLLVEVFFYFTITVVFMCPAPIINVKHKKGAWTCHRFVIVWSSQIRLQISSWPNIFTYCATNDITNCHIGLLVRNIRLVYIFRISFALSITSKMLKKTWKQCVKTVNYINNFIYFKVAGFHTVKLFWAERPQQKPETDWQGYE